MALPAFAKQPGLNAPMLEKTFFPHEKHASAQDWTAFEKSTLTEHFTLNPTALTSYETINGKSALLLDGLWEISPAHSTAYDTVHAINGMTIYAHQLHGVILATKSLPKAALIVMGDCLDEDLEIAAEVLKQGLQQSVQNLRVDFTNVKVENDYKAAAIVSWSTKNSF